MKNAGRVLPVLVALAAFGARFFTVGKARALPCAEKGEVHACVADAAGKVSDLSAAKAPAYLEPKEGERQSLETTRHAPPRSHEEARHHAAGRVGGIPENSAVEEAGAWRVGVVLHEEEGEGHRGEKEKHRPRRKQPPVTVVEPANRLARHGAPASAEGGSEVRIPETREKA